MASSGCNKTIALYLLIALAAPISYTADSLFPFRHILLTDWLTEWLRFTLSSLSGLRGLWLQLYGDCCCTRRIYSLLEYYNVNSIISSFKSCSVDPYYTLLRWRHVSQHGMCFVFLQRENVITNCYIVGNYTDIERQRKYLHLLASVFNCLWNN